MSHLTLDYNLNSSDAIFSAVKTILDTYTALKKELDVTTEEKNSLNSTLQTLQDALNASKSTLSTPGNSFHQRKRKKADTPPNLDSTKWPLSQDLTNDNLNNAALYNSTCDDDEVMATPMPRDTFSKHNLSSDKRRRHKRSPVNGTNKENLKEANKSPIKVSNSPLKEISDNENKVYKNNEISATAETPDTLFLSPTCKKEQKSGKDGDETAVTPVNRSISRLIDGKSEKWKSKATLIAKSTPKKLFPDWPCSAVKKTESPENNETRVRRRSNLSLSRSTRLKQPTISFAKINQNEETFCEGINSSNDESLFSKSGPSRAIGVKVEPPESAKKPDSWQKFNKQKTPSKTVKEDLSTQSSDSVFAILKETDDIIILDESESSEEFFKNLIDKDDDDNEKPEKAPVVETKNNTKIPPKPEIKYSCRECEQYYKVIGKDLDEKELRKRIEKCSKHKKVPLRPDTPPGFWNPTFPETPEGEHIETPVDHRFTRKMI